MESTRVDRWLWAVRLTKTRTDAAAACRGGHVRVNDRPAKPEPDFADYAADRGEFHGLTVDACILEERVLKSGPLGRRP